MGVALGRKLAWFVIMADQWEFGRTLNQGGNNG